LSAQQKPESAEPRASAPAPSAPVQSTPAPGATPFWLVGAYALLAIWGVGYVVLFFTGVIGPR
jgi:hypothetical protein